MSNKLCWRPFGTGAKTSAFTPLPRLRRNARSLSSGRPKAGPGGLLRPTGLPSPSRENALDQRAQIFQRRVWIERASERRVRLLVVSCQPRQSRLGSAIPEPAQLEIVLQRLEKKLDPAVLRLEIAAGDAPQHLRVPDAHHLVFAFGQRRWTLLIEGGDAVDQRLGEAALVDQNARRQEAQ